MFKPWYSKKKVTVSQPARKAGKKKDKHADLIKKLDAEFSTYIRLRDCNNDGYARCVTCNHYDHWLTLQNGHFMTRGNMATRYHEQNCSIQCGGCNGPKKGMQYEHGLMLDQRWGEGTALRMRVLSKTRKDWPSFELEAMITYYRSEIKRLKAEKGWAKE